MVTNDEACTREIKVRIAMAKAILNKKKKTISSASKLDF